MIKRFRIRWFAVIVYLLSAFPAVGGVCSSMLLLVTLSDRILSIFCLAISMFAFFAWWYAIGREACHTIEVFDDRIVAKTLSNALVLTRPLTISFEEKYVLVVGSNQVACKLYFVHFGESLRQLASLVS